MKVQNNFNAIGLAAVLALSFSGQSLAEGSRYDLPREYLSEISSAKAYLEMNKEEAVLVDVRRLREHAAGHPEKAFNVPYPHVVGSNDQDKGVAYWAVYNLVGGKVDTPVITLCRTGFRSVLFANILADPGAYGIDGPAFTNVRNIWEGFVGRYKEANVDPLDIKKPNKNDLLAHEELHHKYLDLNNNDTLDVDVADVYDHTTDANPDKDGWRNYQELPWTTKLNVNRVYLQDISQYDDYVE
jgi:rhodanese-related sulfurtransferase